jgi:hypothetical protein
MNPERIWQDLRRLEKSLINTNIASLPFHQRKETEDFLRLKEWLNLQENLWSLTMTPEDWESLQTLERHMSWTSFQRTSHAWPGRTRFNFPPTHRE